QARSISNFEYLMALNRSAGRSFADLSQYPVMPWVVSDWWSLDLDLEDPATFRDLSKPVGALNPERLETLRKRFIDMPEPKFLYGTHYSTPGYVLHFLVRHAPDLMLHLQRGKFDAPDRTFTSIPSSFRSVTTNSADVKELIPEFFAGDGSFLKNLQGLDLGDKQNGQAVGDVELPLWANDAEDLIARHVGCRVEALECEHVSANLHSWVDLIFGCKQTGAEADEADNLFYPVTYQGGVDWGEVAARDDPGERRALELQVAEFGQCPRQLFSQPHPCRNATPGETAVEPTRHI
ncbi:BEACH domain-containing protein, partial [Baffinella frigidus]